MRCVVSGCFSSSFADRVGTFHWKNPGLDLPCHHQWATQFDEPSLLKNAQSKRTRFSHALKITTKKNNHPWNNQTPLVPRPKTKTVPDASRPRMHSQHLQLHAKIQHSQNIINPTCSFGLHRQFYSSDGEWRFCDKMFPLDWQRGWWSGDWGRTCQCLCWVRGQSPEEGQTWSHWDYEQNRLQ